MLFRLSGMLRDAERRVHVAPAVREYEDHYSDARRGALDHRRNNYRTVSDLYYDLVTDLYEYGWGTSFHFAPRTPGESFKASQARHVHYLAHRLGLQPGMVVADLGCGIGGPLMEIARFSGARIVGINANAHQIERARTLTAAADLSDLAEYRQCDFLDVDAPDHSFDAVYAIEATCYAPEKTDVYGEAFRLLKPGGLFGVYEWALTDRFEAGDPHHLQVKASIELGTGLLEIDPFQTADEALRAAGFDVLEARDLAAQSGPSIPWYQPLAGSGLSLTSFRSSRIGRQVTHGSLRALESLRVLPQGTARVARNLNIGAAALAEAGRLRIFTPMYFLLGRKPA